MWRYQAGRGGALGGIEWGTALDADQAYFPVADANGPSPGGLHAVKLATGERVWFTPPPALKDERDTSALRPFGNRSKRGAPGVAGLSSSTGTPFQVLPRDSSGPMSTVPDRSST